MEKVVTVEKFIEVRFIVCPSSPCLCLICTPSKLENGIVRQVPVEKIVQVEKIVEVKVPVDRIVEKLVEVKVPVDRIVEREKIVEVKVEKLVYQDRHVEVPVERIVTREKIVEVRFMFCCFMLLMHDRHRHACVQIGQINSRMQVACGECC